MAKGHFRKRNVIIVIIIVIILILFECTTTNIADDLKIIYTSEPIIAYQKHLHNRAVSPPWVDYLKRELVPEQAMRIDFWPGPWPYYYTYYLELFARLFTTKEYNELYIKEINYIYNNRTYNLLRDKHFFIEQIRDNSPLLDENHEIIKIDEEVFYWASVNLNKKVRHNFINGYPGQEKQIEIIQVYAFDNEPLREEKYKYKVICGRKKFEPIRLIAWTFPF
ncbi:MAG: hypothetical protein LBI06_00815 [Treponema sp.]|jgi:hypothetical protein|nr:hypothetical protein [Treponema sp.]